MLIKNSNRQKAKELIPILAMWELSFDDARQIAEALRLQLRNMTPGDYLASASGAKIKGGRPETAPINNGALQYKKGN